MTPLLRLQIGSCDAFPTRHAVYHRCHHPLSWIFVWKLTWNVEPPRPQWELRPGEGDQLAEFRDLMLLWTGEKSSEAQYTPSDAALSAKGYGCFSFSIGHHIVTWYSGPLASKPQKQRWGGGGKAWPVSFWAIRERPSRSDWLGWHNLDWEALSLGFLFQEINMLLESCVEHHWSTAHSFFNIELWRRSFFVSLMWVTLSAFPFQLAHWHRAYRQSFGPFIKHGWWIWCW